MKSLLQRVQSASVVVDTLTLAADTSQGHRPRFSSAAPPEHAAELFAHWVKMVSEQHPVVASGQFGASMQVHLVNDGPVTFWLEF